MLNMYDNTYYINIVRDILDNEEFNKIKYIEHHGTTRFEHSMRVAYFSYGIAKLLRLDYKEVARAGLLHDFFLSDMERTTKDRFLSTFTHPKYAVETASKHFELSDKEVDIIKSHMFPLYTSIPKYAESWIVSLVDKTVGLFEFLLQFRYKFSYAFNMYILFIINVIK